ncbi:MAG: hypothetical protein ABSE40_12420 [Candidatus Sulfotelmatobacter sp.]|jgi:hypothetical protein
MTDASPLRVEIVADDMFALVKECTGKRKLKAGDLTKAMIAKHGEPVCDKETCRKAIRMLIDSGRCIYTYLGGSYIELPSPPEDAQQL